jgi:trehalose 6-phosphate phosphatase
MTQTDAHLLGLPPDDLLVNASVFLDFDGTLVEIAPRPWDVRVDDRLTRLLNMLSTKLQGRIAVVSGRPVKQLRALFSCVRVPLAGSHGAEIAWPDSSVYTSRAASPDPEIVARIHAFQHEHPGIVVEEKPFGIAIHYRLAPWEEAGCRRLAESLAREAGYEIQTGKQVVELKTSSITKASAVARFMEEPPMAGTRPVFLGDDDTDEAGFALARRLGGCGVLVGAPRSTTAVYGLRDVSRALDWLERAGSAA